MENIDGHEGAQDNQPSIPISRPQKREEQDSNQSDQRRRVDETSATEDDDNNNNISSLSISQENCERLIEQAHLEDAIHYSDNDDDETEEEESSVSNEGWNSNQSNQSILVDETSATEDGNDDNNNSNSSITISSLEDLEQALQRQMTQNQRGTTDIPAVGRFLINNEDRSLGTIIAVDVRSLNSIAGSSEDGRLSEELMELIRRRIGTVQRGLSKETISSHLKTRVHTTSAESTEEENEICTICQDEYENKVKIATLDCQHEYHEDCITKWLVRKNLCPLCNRQALKAMERC